MRIKSMLVILLIVLLIALPVVAGANIVTIPNGESRQIVCADGRDAKVMDSDAFGLVITCPYPGSK